MMEIELSFRTTKTLDTGMLTTQIDFEKMQQRSELQATEETLKVQICEDLKDYSKIWFFLSQTKPHQKQNTKKKVIEKE